jgi:hypothetical protein
VDDGIGPAAVADEQAQPALAVEHVAAGGVVDGVAARLLARHLRVEHLEFLGRLRGLLGRAVQADEALVEGRHVLASSGWVSRSGSRVMNSTCTWSACGPSFFITPAISAIVVGQTSGHWV